MDSFYYCTGLYTEILPGGGEIRVRKKRGERPAEYHRVTAMVRGQEGDVAPELENFYQVVLVHAWVKIC